MAEGRAPSCSVRMENVQPRFDRAVSDADENYFAHVFPRSTSRTASAAGCRAHQR
jgi:hypothetical protein